MFFMGHTFYAILSKIKRYCRETKGVRETLQKTCRGRTIVSL